MDSDERPILTNLGGRLPLPNINDQVVADLLRDTLSVRAYLQLSVVTVDPMPASPKRHSAIVSLETPAAVVPWEVAGTNGGEHVEMTGRGTIVSRRQPDGSWRILLENSMSPE